MCVIVSAVWVYIILNHCLNFSIIILLWFQTHFQRAQKKVILYIGYKLTTNFNEMSFHIQLVHTVCFRLAFSNAPVMRYFCKNCQSYMLNMKNVTVTCGHAVLPHNLARSVISKGELRKKFKGLHASNN